MPHTMLVCPHCDATLRPGKPIDGGKPVRCPKCKKTFTSPDEEERRPKKAAAAVTKQKAAEPAPAKKLDDDEGGIYGVARDPAEEARKAEEEARRERKRRRREEEDEEDEDEDEDDLDDNDPVTQYLKNLKSKDPRGPAQMAVVGPSNWLLRSALLGFFGWVITLIFFMIPIAFPIREKEEEVDKWGRKVVDEEEEKAKKNKKPNQEVFNLEMILLAPLYVVAFVAALLLGVIHACLIAVGAVKMNSLESYRWSIASSILTIIPIHVVPTYYFVWKLLDFMEMYEMSYLIALVALLFGPLVGAGCLLVLKRPEIQEGFAFKPD